MNEREFFNEWSRLTVALKDSEKARLIDAISSFASDGKMTALIGKEACLLPVFCNLITTEKQSKERTV